MKATFENTVDILVKAYLEGVLIHGDCAACAVGNIVAASVGSKIYYDEQQRRRLWKRGEERVEPIWQEVFVTVRPQGRQEKNPHKYRGYFKMQIDRSGYTWKELAQIEKAFESVAPCEEDQYNFDGLMKVVDALAEIHGINLEQKEEAKLQFVKS